MEGLVILRDRICAECGTRYSPPVPRWAPVTMSILGALVVVFGVSAAIAWVLFRPIPGGFGQPMGTIILACMGGGLFMYGVRMVRNSGEPLTVYLCPNCRYQLPQHRLNKCSQCKCSFAQLDPQTTDLERAMKIISTDVGVLYGAFSIIDGSEFFPPRNILNDFLSKGTDACDQDGRMYRWKPFEIAPNEYDLLKAWWLESHPHAREELLGATTWGEWFSAVLDW